MPRPPLWLKRLLLPAWNGGHRVAWKAGEVAGAIARRRWGRCPVCGKVGLYLHRPRAIPSELRRRWGLSTRVATAVVRKETDDCSRCGAKLRARRLALVVLDLYPVGNPPAPAHSVAAWIGTEEARALRVAEFNRVEGLHEMLESLPAFEASDYADGAAPGAMVDGVRSEDLTRLTHPDAAFDLVVTSETLEHVPDLDAALREIRRVLVPGGRHVFTVPLLPGVPATYARARLDDDGTRTDLAPPIFHPGGNIGYPVFTEFGADFPDLVRAAGFEVVVRFGPTTEDDVAQVYVARRPD